MSAKFCLSMAVTVGLEMVTEGASVELAAVGSLGGS